MARRRPGRRRYRKKIAPPPGAKAPAPTEDVEEIEAVPAAPVPPKPLPPKTVPPKTAAPPPATPASPARPATRQAPSGLAKSGKAHAARSADAGMDPRIGTVVGRCRLDAQIGRGRTSTVYRAHHQSLDGVVAVKILLPKAAAIPQLVESFETEAQAVARIDNENVLKIYDVVREGDTHAIVMELLDGEEVLDIVQREESLDAMDALRIIRQAANGLAAAHERGIVHRDVKPQNLVLLEDGTVKLVDFGLAGSGDAGRVGTPHFMAPETCEDGSSSSASDIYSLGVTLYHLLVGQPPYAGQDVPSIMRSHVRGEPLRPERKRPKLAREIGDLLRSMTAKDPSARPTAPEVIQQLDSFGGEALQEKSGLRRRRSRMRARIAAGRRPNLVAPVAVIAAIGILALLAMMMSKKKTPPPKPPPVPPAPQERAAAVVKPPPPRVDPRAEKEEKARQALADVETWARENWRGKDDNERVRARYRALVNAHFGTVAATEADTRARRIARGEMHAHPDRALTSEEEAEAARALWEKAVVDVEAAIAEHRYLKALRFLPAKGQLEDDAVLQQAAFYRSLLQDLLRFQSLLGKRVSGLGVTKRVLATADGMGPVTRITDETIEIDVDGKRLQVPWTRVGAEDLARLGRRALQGAKAAEQVSLLAFAFAHAVEDPFWEARLDLRLDDLPIASRQHVQALEAALPARMAAAAENR